MPGTQRLPAPPAARPPSLLSTSLQQAPPLPQAEGTAHHSPGSLAGKGAWVRPSKTKEAPVPQKSTQWYYWNKQQIKIRGSTLHISDLLIKGK